MMSRRRNVVVSALLLMTMLTMDAAMTSSVTSSARRRSKVRTAWKAAVQNRGESAYRSVDKSIRQLINQNTLNFTRRDVSHDGRDY